MEPNITTSQAERNLEEEILRLQKLNLDVSVGQVVEEAAQLLAEGRHLEARALIEKADAMMSSAVSGESPPVTQPDPSGNQEMAESRSLVVEEAVGRLVGNLADGLAKILGAAIQDLEQYIVGESRKLSGSFRQQLERLQGTVDDLMQLMERIEQLTATVSEQRSVGLAVQEKYEQLAAGMESLREADAHHGSEIGALRSEMQQLSASVSERLDALAAKLWLQHEEVSGLKSTVSEISPRVAALVERLDRQAEAIRSLHETQTQSETTLDQLVDVLAHRKASAASQPTLPEVQL